MKDGVKDGSIKEMEVKLIPNENQYVVSWRDRSYLMDKSRWPSLKLPSETMIETGEPMEGLTQEDNNVGEA